jgi:hypothetical protein
VSGLTGTGGGIFLSPGAAVHRLGAHVAHVGWYRPMFILVVKITRLSPP